MQSEMAAVAPFRGGRKADEKPKVQPRVVAQKAIKEIKGVPPKLYLFALGGAGVLILIIAIGVTSKSSSRAEKFVRNFWGSSKTRKSIWLSWDREAARTSSACCWVL